MIPFIIIFVVVFLALLFWPHDGTRPREEDSRGERGEHGEERK